MRNRLTPDAYSRAKQNIVEDYAKTRETSLSSRNDPGAALETGSTAAFKAVQESRNALVGLQDKNTELMQAQNDLTGQSNTLLQHISDRLDGAVRRLQLWIRSVSTAGPANSSFQA